ncbi:hypothetical protein [Micromonospora endophytica]|nr:hypothetical protein [Micromonospora endophytica]
MDVEVGGAVVFQGDHVNGITEVEAVAEPAILKQGKLRHETGDPGVV